MASSRGPGPWILLLVTASALARATPVSPNGLDGPGVYEVGWRLIEDAHAFEGRLDEGASRELRLTVADRNVTDIAVVVRWAETDDPHGLSQPDRFSVALRDPGLREAPGSPVASAVGVARVSSGVVNSVPMPLRVEAESAADVREALAPYAGEAGRGAWTIVVRLESAGNPAGARVDAGNAYAVAVTVRRYEPSLMRVVDLAPPPAMGIIDAASRAPSAWLWTAGGLGAVAVGLGAFLVRDGLRGRRE